MLSVHPSLPARSVSELVALSKTRPSMVPGATPADIVTRLHRESVKALNTPEVKARLAAEGSEVVGSTTEQATATLQRDIEQVAELIRRIGIRQE